MPDEPDDDLLLTGAEIADGTGAPLRPGDVLIEHGRVRAVEPPGTLPRDRPARDLAGLVLAPGFIDVHSHADNAPLLAEDDTTKIRQGVTTEVVGNCGFSLAPRTSAHAETLASFLRRLFPPIEFRWSDFAELFAALDHAGHVTNYCPLVGHGTLRIAALGMSDETADPAAMRVMRDALEEGMGAGAFGLSSGLIYPPAIALIAVTFTQLAVRGRPIPLTYRAAVAVALVFSIIDLLSDLLGEALDGITGALSVIPLYPEGLGWVLPTIVVGAIALVVDLRRKDSGHEADALAVTEPEK